MINLADAQDLFSCHIDWFESGPRQQIENHRDAYSDEFWGKHRTDTEKGTSWEVKGGQVTGLQTANDHDIFPTEVNLVRPWVISFLASLYYDGIRFEVQHDELPHEGEDDADRLIRASAIRNTLNRFAESSEMEEASNRVYSMGITYPGGVAFKLCVTPKDERLTKQSALDLVRVEAIPPWELTWDRRARTMADSRYLGHVRQVPIEKARRLWTIPSDEQLYPLIDIPAHGFQRHSSQVRKDDSYVWVWDLDDYTATSEVDGERLAGKRTTYLVRDMSRNPTLVQLASGATPHSTYDGSPLWECFVMLTEPMLEHPMDSLASAATVYEQNAELNRAYSVVAGQFRRDAARPVFGDPKMDAESLKKFQAARDLEVIPLPPGLRPEDAVFIPDLGTKADTLSSYIGMQFEGMERTNLLTSQTQGQAGQYLKAEEVRALTEYTDATIGRFRKAADRTLSRTAAGFLRIIADVMDDIGEETLDVLVDDEVYGLTTADLRRRWKIRVIDTASDARSKDQKVATFQAAQPAMMENMAIAAPPDPETGHPSPGMQNLAKASHNFYVENLGLPEAFKFDVLTNAAPTSEAPPPPPPPPGADIPPAEQAPEAGQLSPEEAAMLAEAPAAQAIMGAAEAEL